MTEDDIRRAAHSQADDIAAVTRKRMPSVKDIAAMETKDITPMVSISALEMSILLERITHLMNEVAALHGMLFPPLPSVPEAEREIPESATILKFPRRPAPSDDGPEAA